VTIAASTLGIIDAMALCALSFVEHRQSIRPSSLISVYLLFSLAFDAVQCRTLWLLPRGQKLQTIATIFSLSVAFKVAILFLELKEKRSFLNPPWNRAPPESLSGTINRSLYWWINSLFSRGYQGILNLESLWPTDHSLASDKLLQRYSSIWDNIEDKKKKNALAYSLLGSIKWPLVEMVIPRLCLIGFRFAQPLLLASFVNFTSKPEGPEKKNIGYGLIGATALAYFGSGIMQAIFGYKNIRVRTMARGILISMLMSKSLTVTAAISTQKGSSTLTLMSTDVDRIG
jgi:ATP-binding cassette subfamily C (CFTR/MRP) protein 1